MDHASIFNGLFSFSAIANLCPFWCVRTTNTSTDDGDPLGGASGRCFSISADVGVEALLTGQMCVDMDSVNLMRTCVGREDGRGHPVRTGRPLTQDILRR